MLTATLLKCTANTLKDKFSYFTDPFSAQWCTSITHHSQVKARFPLKGNWICPITNCSIFVFCVWHVNSLIHCLCYLIALKPQFHHVFVLMRVAVSLLPCTKGRLFCLNMTVFDRITTVSLQQNVALLMEITNFQLLVVIEVLKPQMVSVIFNHIDLCWVVHFSYLYCFN